MRQKFLRLWSILTVALLMSLMTVASAVAQKPEAKAIFGGEVGIDTLKFIDPWQYTSKLTDPWAPPPVSTFNVGDPLWMHLFINTDAPKTVSATYLLKNLGSGPKFKVFKNDFALPNAGNWRLSLGWPNGVPNELVGTWKLIGIVKSGDERSICRKPWEFTVR
ncbi:hypothetical protein FJZ31_22975 [Candidatus Poribacteria bacterium]|nr:hypothetical protein [Candidatus Poribacteria bacterium]